MPRPGQATRERRREARDQVGQRPVVAGPTERPDLVPPAQDRELEGRVQVVPDLGQPDLGREPVDPDLEDLEDLDPG